MLRGSWISSTGLTCPVCAKQPQLRALDPHLGFQVPLRRCDSCHGVWADTETVRVARDHYHRSHYVMVEGHGRQSCRSCGILLKGTGDVCGGCRDSQQLSCLGCHKPMAIVQVAGVTLDVCKPCKSVWFDRGELGVIAAASASELSERVQSQTAPPIRKGGDGDGLDIAADVLVDGPDLIVLGAEGAHAAGDLALQGTGLAGDGMHTAGELASSAGQAALDVGSASVELAGDAAVAVLELLGAIFD